MCDGLFLFVHGVGECDFYQTFLFRSNFKFFFFSFSFSFPFPRNPSCHHSYELLSKVGSFQL